MQTRDPFGLGPQTLAGRTALVCGASAGIGKATAVALASLGARVIALARTEAALKEVVAGLPGEGHRALACDLNDHARLTELLKKELERAPIEILVNNSAGPKGGPIVEAKPEEFTLAFTQHILTAQLLAQLLTPGMRDRGYGRIVNVISTSVRVPIPNLGVSNTIRGAMASWAKTMSLELGPHKITVNSVLPGYTETERLSTLLQGTATRLGKTPEAVADEWKGATPARRFGKPEEIAAAVAFLASPLAGFINGVVLPVDGGRTGSI